MAVEPHAPRRVAYDPAADAEFPPPDLGRTVHVVDPGRTPPWARETVVDPAARAGAATHD